MGGLQRLLLRRLHLARLEEGAIEYMRLALGWQAAALGQDPTMPLQQVCVTCSPPPSPHLWLLDLGLWWGRKRSATLRWRSRASSKIEGWNSEPLSCKCGRRVPSNTYVCITSRRCYRYAENKSFGDCLAAILPLLLDAVRPSSASATSDAALFNAAKAMLTAWSPLLAMFVTTPGVWVG